ncbi:WD40 repeat domain-containing protein [Dictyobacter formicarum]|uniref:Anaphase-promoting complex subunit 4 WD40 domain-containing protein n=1 Tax=Dictyobacter formicarum TaxID=2778368 RepID=A0ABQ3VQ82_9CHLR|nr:hypothetical protein [Dictyobacter formicarum]GHO87256.1 hypothetical protein KSZ_52620 [Dictyobacter formicarum]
MGNFFAWLASIAGASPVYAEQLWDCRAGLDPSVVGNLNYYSHAEGITALTCSSDTWLVASASEDHAIHIWNVQTRYAVLIYRETVNAVLAWLPDATLSIFTSTDRVLYIWDVWTNSCVQTQKQSGGRILSSGSAS